MVLKQSEENLLVVGLSGDAFTVPEMRALGGLSSGVLGISVKDDVAGGMHPTVSLVEIPRVPGQAVQICVLLA